MLNINVPQRFYQIEFKENHGCNFHCVIDLKQITEITLMEGENQKDILINLSNSNLLRPIKINKDEVASEVFGKLVTAWTTYKLATEN